MFKKVSQRKKYLTFYQAMSATAQNFECRYIDTVDVFNSKNSNMKYLHLIIDNAAKDFWAFLSKTEQLSPI